jgi:hypothetical protein
MELYEKCKVCDASGFYSEPDMICGACEGSGFIECSNWIETVTDECVTAEEIEIAANIFGPRANSPRLGFVEGAKWYRDFLRSCLTLAPQKPLAEKMEVTERDARQKQIFDWAVRCFGEIATDLQERVRRQLEEALELAQAEKLDKQEAHDLIEYVYSRPHGEPKQEVGGILITLLAYCEAKGISAEQCEVVELTRILSKSEEHFRERQNAKAESGVALRSRIAQSQKGGTKP